MPLDPPSGRGIDRLLQIMALLRSRDGGCPWDLEQSFATIAPHTIEEAYEVADAIERQDMAGLKDELGDLLFQVVFHGRMAEELGLFAFDDVAAHCADKMVRRHPHVFGERTGIVSADDQTQAWEDLKAVERAGKTKEAVASALDGVTVGLPALTRAVKIQKRAARVGFDWTEAAPILDKIEEEIGELRAELAKPNAPAAIEEELGDLVFAVANLARRLAIDPEQALKRATAKFERRFRDMEASAAEAGTTLNALDLDEQERLWQSAKMRERL